MAKGKDSFPVEVRRVEHVVHETGVGASDRTDVVYELGAQVGDAWVVFGTRAEGHVEQLQERATGDDGDSGESGGSTETSSE